MIRLISYLLALAAFATGLAWLADQPTSVVVNWQGTQIETTVFFAAVGLAILLGLFTFLWALVRNVFTSPSNLRKMIGRRRQQRGIEALSRGLIAAQSGDTQLTARFARQARLALPHEPLTAVLQAQSAALTGDLNTARRLNEGMLGSAQTEVIGLKGLYQEALRVGEPEAAQQFAERALSRNPRLAWPVDGLFQMQCRKGDWTGALETLAIARRNDHVDRKAADRRRAVLLTAQALALEASAPERAMKLADEAHKLAHDLVPAAALAGRLYSARGSTGAAAAILADTWKRQPHPDLALAYAYARLGDSPRDRLRRVKELAAKTPHHRESHLAVAAAAIEARDWQEAREALDPLLEDGLSERVCVLMARIEGGEKGDTGRVREWLARAVSAPRDPVWIADGEVSEQWAPVSPASGVLDGYEWKVAEERKGRSETGRLLEELALAGGTGAAAAPVITVSPVSVEKVPALGQSSMVPRNGGAEAPVMPLPQLEPSRTATVTQITTVSGAGSSVQGADKPVRNGDGQGDLTVFHAPDDPGLDGEEAVVEPLRRARA